MSDLDKIAVEQTAKTLLMFKGPIWLLKQVRRHFIDKITDNRKTGIYWDAVDECNVIADAITKLTDISNR